MIGNHYGSLIDIHGHFMPFRARSDPSLPFMAIDTAGTWYHSYCIFRCKHLIINYIIRHKKRQGKSMSLL